MEHVVKLKEKEHIDQQVRACVRVLSANSHHRPSVYLKKPFVFPVHCLPTISQLPSPSSTSHNALAVEYQHMRLATIPDFAIHLTLSNSQALKFE
jgi:hypothetical protein